MIYVYILFLIQWLGPDGVETKATSSNSWVGLLGSATRQQMSKREEITTKILEDLKNFCVRQIWQKRLAKNIQVVQILLWTNPSWPSHVAIVTFEPIDGGFQVILQLRDGRGVISAILLRWLCSNQRRGDVFIFQNEGPKKKDLKMPSSKHWISLGILGTLYGFPKSKWPLK